jgi:hypothetical protein
MLVAPVSFILFFVAMGVFYGVQYQTAMFDLLVAIVTGCAYLWI